MKQIGYYKVRKLSPKKDFQKLEYHKQMYFKSKEKYKKIVKNIQEIQRIKDFLY